MTVKVLYPEQMPAVTTRCLKVTINKQAIITVEHMVSVTAPVNELDAYTDHGVMSATIAEQVHEQLAGIESQAFPSELDSSTTTGESKLNKPNTQLSASELLSGMNWEQSVMNEVLDTLLGNCCLMDEELGDLTHGEVACALRELGIFNSDTYENMAFNTNPVNLVALTAKLQDIRHRRLSDGTDRAVSSPVLLDTDISIWHNTLATFRRQMLAAYHDGATEWETVLTLNDAALLNSLREHVNVETPSDYNEDAIWAMLTASVKQPKESLAEPESEQTTVAASEPYDDDIYAQQSGMMDNPFDDAGQDESTEQSTTSPTAPTADNPELYVDMSKYPEVLPEMTRRDFFRLNIPQDDMLKIINGHHVKFTTQAGSWGGVPMLTAEQLENFDEFWRTQWETQDENGESPSSWFDTADIFPSCCRDEALSERVVYALILLTVGNLNMNDYDAMCADRKLCERVYETCVAYLVYKSGMGRQIDKFLDTHPKLIVSFTAERREEFADNIAMMLAEDKNIKAFDRMIETEKVGY